MAKIESGMTLTNGCKLRNRVTVDLLLTDQELDQLEDYRARSEKRLNLPKGMEYTLDDVILYILGEAMSGRGFDIKQDVFA